MSAAHTSKSYDVKFTKLEPKADAVYGSPCSRSSHGLSLVKGNSDEDACDIKLVLMGGEHVARTPLPIEEMVWIAERSRDQQVWTWRRSETKQEYPPVRLAHAQAVVGQDVYIFGGRSGVDMGETAMNDLWKFHLPTETWTQIPTPENAPPPRSFHRMIALTYPNHQQGTSLFVFGGCGTSGRLNDLWEFHLNTETWTCHGSSQFLAGRGGPNLLSFLTPTTQTPYLAIVAGFKGEESKDGHICHFASEDGTWKWADALMSGLDDLRPRSVCVAASFTNTNMGLVFGGEVDPSDRGHEGAGGFANDLILLDGSKDSAILQVLNSSDASSNEWPQTRGWADGDTLETPEANYLFFYGGLSGNDQNPMRLDDLWQCEIA